MRRISLLAAAIAAAALTLSACSGGGPTPPPPPACALSGDACADSGQCCSSYCMPDPLTQVRTCACAAVPGMRCASSADCCEESHPTLSCVGGACVQACRPNGDVCTSGFSCCSGACGPGGTCAEPCHVAGGACTTSAQCCADFGCTGGTPARALCSSSCSRAGGGCAVDNDCCSGLDCRGSTCLGGTCSTVGEACSGDPDCCGHLSCHGGSCTCGWVGHPCTSTLDCCGGYACGLDGLCHDQNVPDGGACIADGDCVLGSCPGGLPVSPAVCCQDPAASCAQAGARCCTGSVCRGPADGTQRCGACMPLLASTCYRTEECCSGNLCDGGRCCKPIAAACAGAQECCDGRCDLYENGTGGIPHCCGGPGAPARLDTVSTCCAGYQRYGTGGPWPEAACFALAGSECRTTADCYDAKWSTGVVCMPRDPASGSPTVCSSYFDHACSADVPCPSPLVCDATQGVCLVPAGESCASPTSLCATGTECDNGTCCAPPATACNGPQDCCTGLCTGGACQCGGPKVHCAGPEHCCPGTHCEWQSTGTADFTCCAEERSACSTDTDCCPVPGGRLCDAVDRVCCRPANSSCSYTEWQQGLRCCGGTVCTRQSSGGYLTYVCK